MSDLKVSQSAGTDHALGTSRDVHDLEVLGYRPEMRRNRNTLTLLFQSLAIAAVRLGLCTVRFPS